MLNKKNVVSTIFCIIFLFLSSTFSLALEVEAITKPSADILLSFVRGGNIAEVLTKVGDNVDIGEVLARQEDGVEKLQLLQWEAKARNKTRIEAVKAGLAQKQKDLEKFIWAREEGAVTDWEVDHTRLEILTAKINLRQAELDFKQTKLQRDELKEQIKLLTITSPISGLVEEVLIERGESAQPLKPVLRVVKINPLWIDVPLPISYGVQIEKGQTATVRSSDSQGNLVMTHDEAKIINISAVADAASDTLKVRIEFPNLQNRPAGERVTVIFE